MREVGKITSISLNLQRHRQLLPSRKARGKRDCHRRLPRRAVVGQGHDGARPGHRPFRHINDNSAAAHEPRRQPAEIHRESQSCRAMCTRDRMTPSTREIHKQQHLSPPARAGSRARAPTRHRCRSRRGAGLPRRTAPRAPAAPAHTSPSSTCAAPRRTSSRSSRRAGP